MYLLPKELDEESLKTFLFAFPSSTPCAHYRCTQSTWGQGTVTVDVPPQCAGTGEGPALSFSCCTTSSSRAYRRHKGVYSIEAQYIDREIGGQLT